MVKKGVGVGFPADCRSQGGRGGPPGGAPPPPPLIKDRFFEIIGKRRCTIPGIRSKKGHFWTPPGGSQKRPFFRPF